MLNKKGQEVPDPTPMELPLGYEHPLPLDMRIAQLIRSELSQEAARKGFESFEEANDFGEDDEADGVAYKDEDDEFAVNDPYLEQAAKELEPQLHKLAEEIKARYNKQEDEDGDNVRGSSAGDHGSKDTSSGGRGGDRSSKSRPRKDRVEHGSDRDEHEVD